MKEQDERLRFKIPFKLNACARCGEQAVLVPLYEHPVYAKNIRPTHCVGCCELLAERQAEERQS